MPNFATPISDWQPVGSTSVTSVKYDNETQTLSVQFHSGKTYNYANVPPDELNKLLYNSSPGGYITSVIAKQYSGTSS